MRKNALSVVAAAFLVVAATMPAWGESPTFAVHPARINVGWADSGMFCILYHWLGDANLDYRVNILDLIFVRNRLGQAVSSGNNWQADVNQDGKINILDLIAVRNQLGVKCAK